MTDPKNFFINFLNFLCKLLLQLQLQLDNIIQWFFGFVLLLRSMLRDWLRLDYLKIGGWLRDLAAEKLLGILESMMSCGKLFADLSGHLLLTQKGITTPNNGQTPTVNHCSDEMSNELRGTVSTTFGGLGTVNVNEFGGDLKYWG